jgi:hypothetical protein
LIDIPADADGPSIDGAIWYPCAEPPGEVRLDNFTLRGVKDCPLRGDKLPQHGIRLGRTRDLSIMFERPAHIKRLVDYMIGG